MVRERKSTRPKRATSRAAKPRPARAKAGSIWDTPRVKKMLAQPVGSPIDLTREEAIALAKDAFGRGKGKWPDGAEYVKRVRRTSGALLVRPND